MSIVLSHHVLGWTDITQDQYTGGCLYVESQCTPAELLAAFLQGQLLPPITLTRLERAVASGIPLEPQAVDCSLQANLHTHTHTRPLPLHVRVAAVFLGVTQYESTTPYRRCRFGDHLNTDRQLLHRRCTSSQPPPLPPHVRPCLDAWQLHSA